MYNWTDKTKVDHQLIITVYKSHKSEKFVEIKLDIVSLVLSPVHTEKFSRTIFHSSLDTFGALVQCLRRQGFMSLIHWTSAAREFSRGLHAVSLPKSAYRFQ